MVINKKDAKKLPGNVLSKANEILTNISSVPAQNLNIDRDIRSVKVSDQYRLIYRASTMKECRVISHNNYNKLISHINVNSIG